MACVVQNPINFGSEFPAVLIGMAVKEKEPSLERRFADFGARPYAKTVPLIDGGIEVPQDPGLGADPEEELIAQYKV